MKNEHQGRRYFGQPGHFIGAASCRFHLHTHVGGFCVSTVGDWHPVHCVDAEPEQIGLDRLYETMVFELGDDDAPKSWANVDFAGYNDRDVANRGHERMVAKYEAGGANGGASSDRAAESDDNPGNV